MAKVQRTSLVEKVRVQMLADIADGRFGELLPSRRRLARDLGVSVPTVGLALKALAEEGWVTGRGDRRLWEVRRVPPKSAAADRVGAGAKPELRRKRLLFLVPRSMDDPSPSWMGLLQNLLRSLDQNEWEVVQWSEKYLRTTRPRKSWDTMINLLRPDYMVVFLGMPVIGEWAAKKGVRTLFIGGVTEGTGVPMVGVSFSGMARETLNRLLRAGHKRILVPMFGKNERFVANLRKTAREIEQGQQGEATIKVAESTYSTPEVVVQLLERIWPAFRFDAVVFADWNEFIAASLFFRRNNIEIGREVSVVVTADDPVGRWFLPKIAHFRIPPQRLARAVRTWLQSPPGTHSAGSKTISATWINGESLRDLRR